MAPAQIDDAELLRLLEQHKTIDALSKVTFYNREHLRKRLRRLGVPPRASGRPCCYWEAAHSPDKPPPMVHANRRCRQLRKANEIRRAVSTEGRTFCQACTPALDEAQLGEMKRIAFESLRKVVLEVMGEDAAAAVLARMEW